MKINFQEILIEEEVFGWEDQFGTDCLCPPGHEFEGLPYWVEYMPPHLRQAYLARVNKKEFVEYHEDKYFHETE